MAASESLRDIGLLGFEVPFASLLGAAAIDAIDWV